MTTAQFAITHAGPQITVQDAGRGGLLRYGVPRSGPMDRSAHRIANLAVGNAEAAPAIEVSLGGLALHCTHGRVSFATAGGRFQVMLNNRLLPPWGVAGLAAGDTLTIRPGRWGAWCYLAFAGHLNSNVWLGSAATHGPSGLGGGALISAGSLTIRDAEVRPARHCGLDIPVSARPRHRVRVVIGPQDRFFAAAMLQTLVTSPFTLTDASDRMGVRLSGPLLTPDAALDMPSEPVQRGSVQVAGDGVATVLLADHQTTGGYPKIATILSGDLDGFVQLRSRSVVHFDAVSPQAAVAAYRTRHLAHAGFLAHLAGRQDHKD